LEFGYPHRTRSVGVHVKPCGLAPFLPMPPSEECETAGLAALTWHSGSRGSSVSRRGGWPAPTASPPPCAAGRL